MTIYKHNLSISPGSFSAPPITVSNAPLLLDKLNIEAFINACYNNIGHAPTAALYNKVLANLVVTPLSGIGGTAVLKPLPDRILAFSTINRGYISEVCLIYSIWYLTEKFNTYSPSYSSSGPIFPDGYMDLANHVTSNDILSVSQMRFTTTTYSLLSYLFQAGNSYYAGGGGIIEVTSFNKKFEDLLMRASAGRVFGESSAIRNRPIIMDIPPSLIPSGTLTDTQRAAARIALYPHINLFLDSLSEAVEELVTTYAKRIFIKLFNDPSSITNPSPATNSMILATGDGTATSGLFGIYDRGVFFFSYKSNVNSANNSRTQSLQRRTGFSSFGGGMATAIHLSMYGLDFSAPYDSKITIDFVDGGVTYTIKFLANQLNPILRPDPSISGISYTKIGFRDYFYVGSTLLGYYDTDSLDFVFNNINDVFNIDITLESGDNDPTNPATLSADETNVILCLIEGPKFLVSNFVIELNSFYRPDEFELTLNQMITHFPSSISDQDKLTTLIDDFIDQLLVNQFLGLPFDLTCSLTAGFVGIYSDVDNKSSEIVSDTNFQDINPDNSRTLEYVNLPGTPLEKTRAGRVEEDFDSTDYANFRHSNCKFALSSTGLNIHIESYVDPQLSGLFNKVNNDFRIVGTVPDLTAPTPSLISKYANQQTTTGTDSYNPLLSGLRCFGILEAVKYKINARVYEKVTNGEITGSQGDIINIRVNNMFIAATSDILWGATVTPAFDGKLNHHDYENLKWYGQRTDGSDPNSNAYDNYLH